jgi:hypothetical protein
MNSMRSHLSLPSAAIFLASALLLSACGGRQISDGVVQNLIANLPEEAINKDDISIESVRQNGNNAIVQVNVRTAFRLEKVNNDWVIREIRLGDDQWQSLDELREALNGIKIEETRRLLDQVVAALDQFVAKNGALPLFKDYVSLTDTLMPEHLTQLIRLDAWRHSFVAELISADTVRLASAGPDGKFGTTDDILTTRRFIR